MAVVIFGSGLTNEECDASKECGQITIAKHSGCLLADDDARTTSNGIRAADLFNQQIWCWGRDIECPGENLLVRHGFDRMEKPRGSSATSLYRLDISPTVRVVLRGFGVFYGDDRWGGLFLRRSGFIPMLTPASDLPCPAWRPENLPRLTAPRDGDLVRSRRLLLELLDWIRQYEVWIAETKGLDYRRRTLGPWHAKEQIVTPAEELANAWRLLGVAIADDSWAVTTRCRANERHRHG